MNYAQILRGLDSLGHPGRETDGNNNGRSSGRKSGFLALAFVVALLVGPLAPATAHLTSWSTLAEDVDPTLRALAAHGEAGIAVGDTGLVLLREGDDWLEHTVPTDEDLRGAAMSDADHAIAVGEQATMLEYRHRLETAAGDPSGVQSAATATSMSRAQWKIPLDSLAIDEAMPLGIGAWVSTSGHDGMHPERLHLGSPETLEPVALDDIATGSPPLEGSTHPGWISGHHAERPVGDTTFSLYLLHDDNDLYAMLETDADADRLTFIVKGQAGTLWDAADIALTRSGQALDGADHEKRDPTPTWQTVPEVQELTSADLHAVSIHEDGSVLAAGSGGTILARESGRWTLTTVNTAKTLKAIDFDDEHGYLAGGDADGTQGAVMYRYQDGQATRITLPIGSYGLWDLDLTGCHAAGSGGALLACQNGSPSDWQRQTLSGEPTLVAVREDAQGTSWAAGSIGSEGAFYRKMPGGSWNKHGLPSDTAEITAATLSEAGPMIATLTGEIFILRAHAPRFVDMPSTVQGQSGEEIEFTIQLEDNDSDIVDLILDPEDVLPDPKPTIKQLKKYLFKIIWNVPPDLDGVFEVVTRITDGLHETDRNITIIVDPANHPPVWEPQADLSIPHSMAWTHLLHATDSDGDPLLLTDQQLPPGASFNDLGGGLGELSWTPSSGDLGEHPVAVQADDGEFQVPLTFNITVVDRQPPTIDHLSPKSARICVAGPWWSGTMTFTASATDPDGGSVDYTWSFPDDGTVRHGPTVSHTFAQLGVYDVVLTVTNDAGVTTTRTIPIRVVDCVEVDAEIDRDCWGIFEQPTGSVRLWDHEGTPIDGTYTLKVWWRGVVGGDKVRTVEGEIVDGVARWTIPYDLEPLGMNELGRHEVFVTGTNPDGVMGPRSKTVSLEYTISPFCDPKLPLP